MTTHEMQIPPTSLVVWLTIGEVQAVWGLARRSVDYAIWRDNIKARQSKVGATWLITADSCAEYWGRPKNEDLMMRILEDVRENS